MNLQVLDYTVGIKTTFNWNKVDEFLNEATGDLSKWGHNINQVQKYYGKIQTTYGKLNTIFGKDLTAAQKLAKTKGLLKRYPKKKLKKVYNIKRARNYVKSFDPFTGLGEGLYDVYNGGNPMNGIPYLAPALNFSEKFFYGPESDLERWNQYIEKVDSINSIGNE